MSQDSIQLLKNACKELKNSGGSRSTTRALCGIFKILSVEKVSRGVSNNKLMIIKSVIIKSIKRSFKTHSVRENQLFVKWIMPVDEILNRVGLLISGTDFDCAMDDLFQQIFEYYILILIFYLNGDDIRLQLCSMRFLFKVISNECIILQIKNHNLLKSRNTTILSDSFPFEIFSLVIMSILQSKNFSPEFVCCILDEYLLKYVDLRYYFLLLVEKILSFFRNSKQTNQQRKNLNFDNVILDWHLSDFEISNRLFLILSKLPTPKKSEEKDFAKLRKDSEEYKCSGFTNNKIEDNNASSIENFEENGNKNLYDSSEYDNSASESGEVSQSVEYFVEVIRENETQSLRKAINNKYNRLFQKVWLEYINLATKKSYNGNDCRTIKDGLEHTQTIHSTATLVDILDFLPENVMKYLDNPLCLADFFIHAFETEKNISVNVSALTGLFHFLTSYNLSDVNILNEYIMNDDDNLNDFEELTPASRLVSNHSEVSNNEKPKIKKGICNYYYDRMYYMITPELFLDFVNKRKFLNLVELSMNSPLVPSTYKCTFIKKLTRIACMVPGPPCLWICNFILSTIQKNPSLFSTMLHLPNHLASKLSSTYGDSFDMLRTRIHRRCFNNIDKVQTTGGLHQIKKDNANLSCDRYGQKINKPSEKFTLCLEKCVYSTSDENEIPAGVLDKSAVSLWEIDLLINHQSQFVRNVSALFDICISDMPNNKRAHSIVNDSEIFFDYYAFLENEIKPKKIRRQMKSTKLFEHDVNELRIPKLSESSLKIPRDSAQLMFALSS